MELKNISAVGRATGLKFGRILMFKVPEGQNWYQDIVGSSPVGRFWCLRCLNDHIDLLNMIGSLTSGATNSLVAKIRTKDLVTSCSVHRIWNNGWILMFKVSKRLYQIAHHDRIICKWCHCLPGGQKWNKKNYLSCLKEDFDVQDVLKTIFKCPAW